MCFNEREILILICCFIKNCFSSPYISCNICFGSFVLLTDFFPEHSTVTASFVFSLSASASSSRPPPSASSSNPSPSTSFPFSFCQTYVLGPLSLRQDAPFLAGLTGDFCHVFLRRLKVHLEIEDDEGILRENFPSPPSRCRSGSGSGSLATTAYRFSFGSPSATIHTRFLGICLLLSIARRSLIFIRLFNNTSAKDLVRFISLLRTFHCNFVINYKRCKYIQN